jgi:hypothetical protein
MAVILPKFDYLPATLPLDGAIRIELEQGLPVFRASATVQQRIEALLHQQQETGLTAAELEELEQYAEIDDYLSFINRLVNRHPPADDPLQSLSLAPKGFENL